MTAERAVDWESVKQALRVHRLLVLVAIAGGTVGFATAIVLVMHGSLPGAAIGVTAVVLWLSELGRALAIRRLAKGLTGRARRLATLAYLLAIAAVLCELYLGGRLSGADVGAPATARMRITEPVFGWPFAIDAALATSAMVALAYALEAVSRSLGLNDAAGSARALAALAVVTGICIGGEPFAPKEDPSAASSLALVGGFVALCALLTYLHVVRRISRKLAKRQE